MCTGFAERRQIGGGGNVPGGEACSRGGFGVFKVVGEGTTPILSDQVCTFRLKKKSI